MSLAERMPCGGNEYTVTYFCRNCMRSFIATFKVGDPAPRAVTHVACGRVDNYKQRNG